MASVSLYEKRSILTKKIEEKNFSRTSFDTGKRISLIQETLPFRIKFTAIQVPGVSPANVPPIPLQVIGFSNYIL